jgi:hypothetical protein
MKAYRWLALIWSVLITVSAVLVPASASELVIAAPPATCNMRLGVVLTPDIPNPADRGFLSSLLSNHPRYQLTLQEAEHDSVLVLELSGPGPESGCRNVIESMRRDARVLSVHVEREPASAAIVPATRTDPALDDSSATSDDTPSVAIVASSWQPKAVAGPHLSLAGLGSVYWGAVHPAQAWKVLAPLQPDNVAYADIRASCESTATALNTAAPCP